MRQHNKSFKQKLLLLAAASFLLSSSNAWAQEPPPGAEPDAQGRRFQADVERTQKALEKKKAKAPEIEIEEPNLPAPAGEVSFLLKGINITGETIFEEKYFKPAYEPYLDKTITLKGLELIIEKIKGIYKEEGYLTVTAYLPEQDIKEGIAEIRVVEGKAGEIDIEGNKWFPTRLIKKYIHIKKNEVLNVLKLQRDLLRLNQNPDLELKSILGPGKEPETLNLTLKAKDHFPWHFGTTFDNQGTLLTGRDRTLLTLRSTDVTGNNDSLFGAILISRDANAQSLSYTLPVDTYGTKLGINFSHFHMIVGKEYKEFNITGDTKALTPYITKELCLSEDFEAYLNAGIDIKSMKKHTDGVTTSDDQMRIPYFGVDITKTDSFGQTIFSPRFDFGTSNFLGASSFNHPTSSRANTGGFFFVYGHTLTRVQRMFLESYCVISSQVQASPQTLPSSEQFQIGGANSVRGYPEGDFLADTGAILNIDWIFPMYPLPRDLKLPNADIPLRQQIQPVFFMDLGGGRVNKTMASEVRDKFLVGIGGGIRIQLYKNLSCRFEWAKDVGQAPTPGSGPSSLNISIQSEL